MNARRTPLRVRRRFGPRRAFTLVEVLVASALLAMLLTAMCAAIASTIDSCQVSQSYSESSGRAKLALGQVAGAVRKSTAVVLTNAKRLDLVDESGNAIAFSFDATTHQLMYEHDLTAKSVLARNVNNLSFTAESEPDPETQVIRIVRLTLSMTIAAPDGGNGPGQQTYSISTAPRRSRSYQ